MHASTSLQCKEGERRAGCGGGVQVGDDVRTEGFGRAHGEGVKAELSK